MLFILGGYNEKKRKKEFSKKQNIGGRLKLKFWEKSWVEPHIFYFKLDMIMLLLLIIIFLILLAIVKLNASENEQVTEGKQILSELKAKENEVVDIRIGDFQKKIDKDTAKWTKKLENKLNEDSKKIKAITMPELKATEEDKKCTTEIIEKSHGVVSEALGISHGKVHGNRSYTDFLIFASFSLGEKNLENLIKSASEYEGVVVFRGLKNGSFKETAEFISKFTKEKEGLLIDPNLFKEYQILKVPSFVLTNPCDGGIQSNCKIAFDKLTGAVTPRYALEKFIERGELKEEAKKRQRRG